MRHFIAILCLAGVVAGGERDEHNARMHEVLKGLGHGIKALKMIDRHEEAQHLTEIAIGIKKKLGAGNKERKVAEAELEVLRLAFVACKEAEKGKWAEMLEHAIHARELRLAGRRDKEAVRVYETEPSQGNVIELLMASSDLWKKFGHEDKAAYCAKLAKKYRAKSTRRGPREKKEKTDVERRLAETEAKIEKLQRHIAELKAKLAADKR